jgi:hypothetical protein
MSMAGDTSRLSQQPACALACLALCALPLMCAPDVVVCYAKADARTPHGVASTSMCFSQHHALLPAMTLVTFVNPKSEA